uniref:Chaperone DnaJ C-terminal domain-containing protein n=1 Tax=Serinus canaria TaxID=9135 RepID=A0A8C9U730_SERCA
PRACGFDQEDMDMDDNDNSFSAFIQFGYNGINGVHQRHQESLHIQRKVQDPPVIHELKVFLEEIYHGSTRRMKITCRRPNADGWTMTEEKILNIVIKQEGNSTPDNIPTDIVFFLKDKPHSHFKRDGTNMVYTANTSPKKVGVSGNTHGVGSVTGLWHVEPRRESGGAALKHLTSNQVTRKHFPPMDSKEELTDRLWEGPVLADATPGV